MQLHKSLPDDVKKKLNLPKKRLTGNFSESNILHRKDQLGVYLDQLVAIEDVIARCGFVSSFLGLDHFARGRGSVENGAGPVGTSGAGMTEFNWVTRTGGLTGAKGARSTGNRYDPSEVSVSATTSHLNGKQEESHRTGKSSPAEGRSPCQIL